MDESLTNLTKETGNLASKEVVRGKLEKKVDLAKFEELVGATKKKDEKWE